MHVARVVAMQGPLLGQAAVLASEPACINEFSLNRFTSQAFRGKNLIRIELAGWWTRTGKATSEMLLVTVGIADDRLQTGLWSEHRGRPFYRLHPQEF